MGRPEPTEEQLLAKIRRLISSQHASPVASLPGGGGRRVARREARDLRREKGGYERALLHILDSLEAETKLEELAAGVG